MSPFFIPLLFYAGWFMAYSVPRVTVFRDNFALRFDPIPIQAQFR
jgi:hypothetical protein